MKTTNFFYATTVGVLLSLVGYSQNLQFQINGKLQNISPMPAKLYLREALPLGLLSKPTDSAEVQNGKYSFSGQLNVDEAVVVMISPDAKGVPGKKPDNVVIMIDKGELSITSDGRLDHYTLSGSGSSANQLFESMKGSQQTADSIKAVMASEAYKTDKQLQQTTQRRSLQLAGKTFLNMYKYAKAHPDDRSSPFMTFELVALPMITQLGKDTLIDLLPEKVKADKLGQAIISVNERNQVYRDSLIKAAQAKKVGEYSKVALGSQAIEITQNDPQGQPVSLSSLRGKYVLVDFWASWCKPCREENPNVVKLYKLYKDKGFTVFGVSLDAESAKTAWTKAIEHDGLTWTQVSDLKGWKNDAATAYDIKSIPQNFLIDTNGKVIAKNLRGGDLGKELASIFNK